MPPLDIASFHKTLGRFIWEFSQTEAALFTYLLVTSRMRINDARAVFTDARINNVKTHINRLRKARGVPDDPKLDSVLNQLGSITRLRNDIVHYGAMPTIDGDLTISDEMWKLENATTYRIKLTDIEDATADICAIKAFIPMHMLKDLASVAPIATVKAPFILTAPNELPPWRYKSPQPIRPPNTNRPKPSKPPRPPKPSAASRRKGIKS